MTPITFLIVQVIGLYSKFFNDFFKETFNEKTVIFYLIAVLCLYILGSIAYFVGIYNAATESTYTLGEMDGKEYIVLLRDGDNSLVAPFDQERKILSPRYTLVENKNLTFSELNIKLELESGLKRNTRILGN